MQFDDKFFGSLYKGRSFKRSVELPEGDKRLASQLQPLKRFATGYESAISTNSRYLLTVRSIHPRIDFDDYGTGLGRLVVVLHLAGHRDIFLGEQPVLKLREPCLGVYYHSPGIKMTSRWFKGSNEQAVIIGSWLSDLPNGFLEHLTSLSTFENIQADDERVRAAQMPLSPRLKRCAEEILHIRMERDFIAAYLEAKTLEALCIAIDHTVATFRLPQSMTERRTKIVQDLLPRIDASIDQPNSVKAIAREAGMSVREFAHCFRSVTQVSYTEYVSRVRLERARALIELSDMPLKQIAHEVGYRHSSNLSAAITKAYGASPRQIRADQSGNRAQ